MKDLITKFNYGNDAQIIITEDIAASVLLDLQIQRVRYELQDYLKTNFFCLNPWNILQKKVGNKIRE